MANRKLQEFVCNVIARDQLSYGDVRRLQRDYLPNGFANREDIELLISLNARLVRADKAWAKWLVASIAEFVAGREVSDHQEPVGEWIGRVLATSTAGLGRRIARQIRRELARRQGIQSTNSDQSHIEGVRVYGVQQPPQAGTPENDLDDCSPRMARPACFVRDESPTRSRPHRRTVKDGKRPAAMTFASAARGRCLAGYLSVVQRSHLMNFQGSRVSLVLAPCQ
jgi:hypothetical protein